MNPRPRSVLAWLGAALVALGLPACSSVERQVSCQSAQVIDEQFVPAPGDAPDAKPQASSPDNAEDSPIVPAEATTLAVSRPEDELLDPAFPPDAPCEWLDCPTPSRSAPEYFRDCAWDFAGRAWDDACNYYSKDNLLLLAAGIAVAAPLANSAADENFARWYQDDVRSESTDEWSRWARAPGDHWYAIPVYLAAACGGKLCENTHLGSTLHTWGDRTLRAALVGAPTVGILQVGLGASRPGEGGSEWRPFQDDNAVAGHGFMGALPFLAAASMTDKIWLRVPLVVGSFATDWSRINDDGHYLSQAILGWWIAYLSVKSVAETDRERNCTFLPYAGDGGPGMSVLWRY